jgi:hypothetical protein
MFILLLLLLLLLLLYDFILASYHLTLLLRIKGENVTDCDGECGTKKAIWPTAGELSGGWGRPDDDDDELHDFLIKYY